MNVARLPHVWTRCFGAAVLFAILAMAGVTHAIADDLIIEAPPAHGAREPSRNADRGPGPSDPLVLWPTPGADTGFAFWVVPTPPLGPGAATVHDLSGWVGFGVLWRWR